MKTPRATHYRITALDPHAHLFEVRCTIAEPDRDGQRFRLPTWIPGSYLIREFARHFVTVRAESGNAAIPIEKEAKDLWHAASCAGPLTVIAEVYAFDLSVRAAYLDAARRFFNGPSVFLCPERRAEPPCVVEIFAPAGPAYRRWRVATTLPRADAAPCGFGSYRAARYDELIGHSVEMADFSQASFEGGGATHDIAVSGHIHADLDRVARDLSSANAATCRRRVSPRSPTNTAASSVLRASHEYFHGWNVKRSKPAAFAPYDLGRENYTRQLWAF